jgi:hypothetical protein
VPDPGLLAKMQGFLTSPQPPAVLDLQVVAQKNLQGFLISLYHPVFLDLEVWYPGGSGMDPNLDPQDPYVFGPPGSGSGSGSF